MLLSWLSWLDSGLYLGLVVARLNNVWWAKPSVWLWYGVYVEYDLTVHLIPGLWHRPLLVYLVSFVCFWFSDILGYLQLGMPWESTSLFGSSCAICSNTWSFIQHSSFHFDIRLPAWLVAVAKYLQAEPNRSKQRHSPIPQFVYWGVFLHMPSPSPICPVHEEHFGQLAWPSSRGVLCKR